MDKEHFRSLLVCLLTFPPLNALAVVISFLLLQQLGFDRRQSLCGALSLLFCTTFLAYTQTHMENNQTMLCILAGTYAGIRWKERDGVRWLVLASFLFGFTLLIRLPNIALVTCAAAFVLGLPIADQFASLWQWPSMKQLRSVLLIAFPIMLFFFSIDRFYQFYRFGSFFSVYVPMPMEDVALHPEKFPPHYPYSGPFLTGFLGPLITPSRSVFIYDPLISISLIVLIARRSIIPARVHLFAVASAAGFVFTLWGYAHYVCWDGASAWSHRFTTFCVQMLAMLAIPLLLAAFKPSPLVGFSTLAITLISLIIQISSIMLNVNLELSQRVNNIKENQFILGQRFINITHYFAGDLLQQPAALSPVEKHVFTTIAFFPFHLNPANTYASLSITAWFLLIIFIPAYALWLLNSNREPASIHKTPVVANREMVPV